MNRDLLMAVAVLAAGIGAMAIALPTARTAAEGPTTTPPGAAALLPANLVTQPIVPGRTWSSDPFTMARLGERSGASVPFPPPPPVERPPLPPMPFAAPGAP